jgi:hypothetical protein
VCSGRPDRNKSSAPRSSDWTTRGRRSERAAAGQCARVGGDVCRFAALQSRCAFTTLALGIPQRTAAIEPRQGPTKCSGLDHGCAISNSSLVRPRQKQTQSIQRNTGGISTKHLMRCHGFGIALLVLLAGISLSANAQQGAAQGAPIGNGQGGQQPPPAAANADTNPIGQPLGPLPPFPATDAAARTDSTFATDHVIFVQPAPKPTSWLEWLDQVTKIAAVLVGGIWVWVNYILNRTHRARLEAHVTAELLSTGSDLVKVVLSVKNVGLSKVDITQRGSAIKIYWYDASDAALPWKRGMTRSIWGSVSWIEPGETCEEQHVFQIPPVRVAPIKFELYLNCTYKMLFRRVTSQTLRTSHILSLSSKP